MHFWGRLHDSLCPGFKQTEPSVLVCMESGRKGVLPAFTWFR